MSTATATAARLQERARRLRSQAASLHPLLAETYRRRAGELEVQAWLEAVWNPPIDLSLPLPTDGPGPGLEGTRAMPLHLAVA
jgi:hypothetical protein